ncbi:hypothetical protein V6N12_058817 [Hibiscus sabdariffa]|uniref:Reverse transcriptase zinc-binding domain-containing protein n=1 Tax=Hibiscus sabdariffa TaxID=183260 RepID=A0ABR2EW12_9ROSI
MFKVFRIGHFGVGLLTGDSRSGWCMRFVGVQYGPIEPILTNVERARRYMTSDSSCPICAFSVEDLHHVLCSCPVAFSIWRRCVRHDRLDEFMSLEIKDWIYTNLSNVGGFVLDVIGWDVFFSDYVESLVAP